MKRSGSLLLGLAVVVDEDGEYGAYAIEQVTEFDVVLEIVIIFLETLFQEFVLFFCTLLQASMHPCEFSALNERERDVMMDEDRRCDAVHGSLLSGFKDRDCSCNKRI